MKISINLLEKTPFRPFEVVISIETKRDLEVISSLTSASYSDMASFLNAHKYDEDYKDFSAEDKAVKGIQDICGAVVNH